MPQKLPQKFSILTCYYRNWNQLSSCYLSQRVDDFASGHVSTDATACLFQHDQEFVLQFCDLFHLDSLRYRIVQGILYNK